MMPQRARNSEKKKPRGDTRFPGICRHARELGVNRISLYRVLTGEWNLPKLHARYKKLIKKEARA